jgi:outer membrane protein assembly factor BamA
LVSPINLLNAQDDTDSENEDSTSHRGLSFNGYPYAYYTPETELAFGVGGIMIFYTGDDKDLLPSKVTLGGWYSTNGQYNISLKPSFYFNHNKTYFELPLDYGFFIDKFWGIGNNTPETGNESYTLNRFGITFKFQVPPLMFFADRSGIIIDYNNTTIDDKQNNAILNNDLVTGSNGGEVIGFGKDLLWDKRDNLFFPNTGTYQYLSLIVYPNISDFVFYDVKLDVKYYYAFAPDHVLAANIYFNAVGGDAPFYKLPALGGSSRMRGYFEGRYVDNVYTTFQLEYRQYFWWRFGFVVFAGFGDVASDLSKFKLNELKPTYGFGLRFLFNKEEKVNLRVDVGIGNDGNSGVYFGIEEAF